MTRLKSALTRSVFWAGEIALILALPGCGGGSSDNASGSVAIAPAPPPPPSPTPTPTPPSAAALPPAPFQLAASQAFVVEGWIGSDAAAIPLEQTNFTFAWSASERTYVTTHPDAGSGRLEYAFPGNNPRAFRLVRDGATVPISYVVDPSVLLPASGEASFGPLQTAPAEWRRGNFAFGLPTPAAAIPTTGTLRFDGSEGFGPGIDLTIDFGSNTVSGSIYAALEGDWGPFERVRYDIPHVPLDRATGRFTFSAVSSHAPLSIELAGRLAGPQGREILVRYDAPAIYPFEEVWVRSPQADAVRGR